MLADITDRKRQEPRPARAPRHQLVDALRGLCFVLMTADHLPANLLWRFSNSTYGPFGFFTAASGFVFLAGLVAGMVYDRHWQHYGRKAMMRRVWRRICTLYLTHLALFFTLWLLVVWQVPGSSTWHLTFFRAHPWKAVWLSVLLLHEPGLLGLLPMYCLFLGCTPLLLGALRRGHVWWLLGGSGVLWVVAGLVIRLPADPEGIRFGLFNPLSYQLLFIGGLTFGTGAIPMDGLSPARERVVVVSAVVIAGCLGLLRWAYALHPAMAAVVEHYHQWVSVVQQGPVRLLNFAACGVVVYWWARHRRWGGACANPLVRGCAFLGEHSLPVCVWSVLTTYLALAVLPEQPTRGVRALALVLAVASLLLPACLHAQLRHHRKKRGGVSRERPFGAARFRRLFTTELPGPPGANAG